MEKEKTEKTVKAKEKIARAKMEKGRRSRVTTLRKQKRDANMDSIAGSITVC